MKYLMFLPLIVCFVLGILIFICAIISTEFTLIIPSLILLFFSLTLFFMLKEL